MMQKFSKIFLLSTFYFLVFNFVSAQIIIPRQPVPGIRGLTLIELSDIVAFVGSFFTTIGPLIAIIAIIISGFMYMKAGGDPDGVKKAKAWLKNALIGALIVLAVGVIINTIANIVTREFFCRLSFFGKCVF